MERTRQRKKKKKRDIIPSSTECEKVPGSSVSNHCLQFSFGLFLRLQPWVPWAPKTVGKWPAQLIGRLSPHLPNHFPGTRKRMKIRERKEGKENVP